MDAVAYLENLRGTLAERGWKAEITQARRGPMLHVAHPEVPPLNDDIVCDGSMFRWAWGSVIGPVDDVAKVADRVQHVLRAVG